MEKKTLILHIGQSKTGTSSIQKFCQTNRVNLAAEGVAYPSVKKSGVDVNLLEHNAFAETLCGKQRYPYLPFDDYIAQFSRCKQDKILLSAESFWGVPHIWTLNSPEDFLSAHRAKLEKLKQWTKDYQLEIVLYLRHPLEWFNSSVSHIIRHEGLLGKKIYQSDEQLYELLKPHMDYMSLISLWQNVLQPDKFSIKAFDRKQLIGGDAVADFCAHIGYQGQISKEIEENVSWPAEVTLLKMGYNQVPHAKWQEWTAIQVLDSIAKQFPTLSSYQIDVELQKRIIMEMKPACDAIGSVYGVYIPEPNVVASREINQEIFGKIEQKFNEDFGSWSVKRIFMSHFIKDILRHHASGLYNYIKFVVQIGNILLLSVRRKF